MVSVNQADMAFEEEVLPFTRGFFISDDTVDMREVIAFDESRLVEFGVIDEQDGLACLFHHDFLDFAFAFI